ncbi:MAG: insulinase family protein [Campylobacteraceae bacterium]|nr:insulinase family protein [Campylobacteraceae bacterium]
MSSTIEHIEYKNIQIPIIYEKDVLPTFNLQLVFKNSGAIKNTIPGLASISSKILNEGTKSKGSVKFFEDLENKAISLHISPGFETLVIELGSLKSEYKEALNYLSALLKDPNYSDKVLNKVKTLQIGSLKSKENDFDYTASVELNKLMFKNTVLESPSAGTSESIKSIKIEDVKKFIKDAFSLENLIIVVGGDIPLEKIKKDMISILKELSKKTNDKLKHIEVVSKVKKQTLYKETKQAYIYFGSAYNAKFDDENNYMAKVASFILGGSGFGSRLMEEIRVKRGLAYSAYGHIAINQSHSYFSGYLQTKTNNAKEAKNLVVSIIDEFVQNGVTKEELEAAKNFLSGSEPLRVETLSQRLSRSFHLYYKGLDQDYSKKELELIENLSLDNLNTYIKKHKEIKKLFFSIVTQKEKQNS